MNVTKKNKKIPPANLKRPRVYYITGGIFCLSLFLNEAGADHFFETRLMMPVMIVAIPAAALVSL